MYQEAHQYEKAAPELEKAVSLKSDDASLQISLGDAYLNLGQDDKALAAFDRATQISATPAVWNNIAYQLSLKQVHLDRAQQYAESAVTAVANGLRNLSLDQVSDRDLAMVSELDANWDTLGWVYFARGNYDKALNFPFSTFALVIIWRKSTKRADAKTTRSALTPCRSPDCAPPSKPKDV